jgi:hypothetical protein
MCVALRRRLISNNVLKIEAALCSLDVFSVNPEHRRDIASGGTL